MFLETFQQNHAIVVEKSISGQSRPFQKCLLSYKNAETFYCNLVHEFPVDIQNSCLHVLSTWVNAWNQHFPHENTWIRDNAGIPSLIARIDCTIVNGKLCVYEVEERPAGIGMTVYINQDFDSRLEHIKKTWPTFTVVVSKNRSWEDDSLWTQIMTSESALTNSDLVLIRAEPDETEFHTLTQRSVSSFSTKGSKAYGVDLNLWRKITHPEMLPFEKAFALKTLQGSKTRGVFIYSPDKLPGSETKTKMSRVYAEHPEGMYLQEYMSPMDSQMECFGETNYPLMIYRTYFGYNLSCSSWECLGGLWNARKSVKIHGASDSIFGPLVPTN